MMGDDAGFRLGLRRESSTSIVAVVVNRMLSRASWQPPANLYYDLRTQAR
jgi:hypothetical protein